MNVPWLTLIIVIPIGASMLLQLVPRGLTAAIKGVTLASTAAVAVITGALIAGMPHASSVAGQPLTLYYQEQRDWIPGIGASYHLGVDGLSGWILALTSGLFLVATLAVTRHNTSRMRLYCSLMLLSQAAIAGVLLAADLLLFYLFWEGMLIPLYFLLSGFGSENRGRATLKFIVYTVAGSLLMLVAILWVYFNHLKAGTGVSPTFDLETLIAQPGPAGDVMVIPYTHIATFTPQALVFIGFAIAFAIKLPLVPFHTWLPDLYEASPIPTLVFFAGVVSKLGAYGFIRFGLTLFPQAVNQFKWLFAALAVLGIVYGALMALTQRDIKRIVAYASLSHLGFIALGIFSVTANGVNGAIIQIVNHGIIIASLFLIVGIVESRTGTRNLDELGGMEKRMPWFYALFLVITLAGLSMPGMNSFVGEFTIMLGAFQLSWVYAVIAGAGVVLAAWYMLRMHQGIVHDPPTPRTEAVRDLRVGERLLLAPLVALMIFLGVFPRPVGDIASPSVTQYVALAHPAASNAGSQ